MTDRNKTPDIDEEDEVLFQGAESAAPASPSKPAALATPTNTPVTVLFPKSFGETGGLKRPFEDVVPRQDTKTITEAMERLQVANNERPMSPADLDSEDKDDGDDNDDDDADEEEEHVDDFEFIASETQRQEVLPDLDKNQEEMWELHSNYLQERFALEEKYQSLYKPLYDKRRQLVCSDAHDDQPFNLPGFWLDCLQRNTAINQFIEEHDKEALSLLRDITMAEFKEEGRFGFELTFKFHPLNPFFSNTELKKRCLCNNLYTDNDAYLLNSTGTDIAWLPGKKLTTVIEEERVKRPGGANRRGGKKGGAVQVIKKEVDRDSFFRLFDSQPGLSEEEIEKLSPKKSEAYQRSIMRDEWIAFSLRKRIIPCALEWYLGTADDSNAEDDEEDGEYEVDEDEEDEDDNEDDEEKDDDDEDDEFPRRKRGEKKAGKALKPKPAEIPKPAVSLSTEEKPECQQQ